MSGSKYKNRIAVNARHLLSGKLQGIGTYSHEVLSRLVHRMPDTEFHFLFDRPYDHIFQYADNVVMHRIGLPARHPILWYMWFEWFVARWLRMHKVDLFFSPDSFLSLRSNLPTLLVMHDLAFEHYDDHVRSITRWYYRRYFKMYARHASKIISVSEYTMKDIMSRYKIPKDKIEFAWNGINNRYGEKSNLSMNGIVDPYFICIGSINPRKNLQTALQAFEDFKRKGFPHKLLIIGSLDWKSRRFKQHFEKMKFNQDVILTGHVSQAQLHAYLQNATALLFLSLFEGFGLPIVEAFACGTPVISGKGSSLEEVAGDSAIVLDQQDHKIIGDAMEEVLNPEIRRELIQKGRERSHLFDWDASAAVIRSEMNKMLNHDAQ